LSKFIAITRKVSPAINQCELTHVARTPIDVERANAQHHEYEQALRSLGVELVSLPAEPNLPDSVFVEDCAIVLDECAIITRPGADSRRPEVPSIAAALAPYRRLFFIQEPATLDGGDVLVVDKTIYVGISSRSNMLAIEQMQIFLTPFGYTVKSIDVTGCLHLKSAITQADERTMIINPEWVQKADFPELDFVEVDPFEAYAANAVMVGDRLLYPCSFPRTQKRLEESGIKLILVNADELAKAEGAVTCCSLIIKNSLI
jgi:dimethylargininase